MPTTPKLSETIPGFSNSDYPWDKIIDQLPMSGSLLEFGTACGLSAVTFAEKFKETNREYNIHTVDHGSNTLTIHGKDYNSEQQAEYINQIVKVWDNITFTKCDFFARYFETPTVFFLDGSHNFNATYKALRIMKDSKIILVDDYNTYKFPRVTTAVDKFAKKFNKELIVLETSLPYCHHACAMLT